MKSQVSDKQPQCASTSMNRLSAFRLDTCQLHFWPQVSKRARDKECPGGPLKPGACTEFVRTSSGTQAQTLGSSQPSLSGSPCLAMPPGGGAMQTVPSKTHNQMHVAWIEMHAGRHTHTHNQPTNQPNKQTNKQPNRQIKHT